MERSEASWHRCTIDDRVVIGTVASPLFANSLLKLAASAETVFGARFRCVAVAVMGKAFEAMRRDERLAALPPPDRPLLPRERWCADPRYGWRRSHLYRVRMWRLVLSAHFDLLAVDLDHYFLSDPLPGLLRARENRRRLDCTGHPSGKQYVECVAASWGEAGPAADVVAQHDGDALKTLNVGLMWVRSNEATVALARRVENRTNAGWEQGVFNEEISFGEHGPSSGAARPVACCHPPKGYSCDLSRHFASDEMAHGLGRNGAESAKVRLNQEGAEVCAPSLADVPPAAPPPNGSRLRWEPAWARRGVQVWDPNEYNELRVRRFGRCTDMMNLCQGC